MAAVGERRVSTLGRTPRRLRRCARPPRAVRLLPLVRSRAAVVLLALAAFGGAALDAAARAGRARAGRGRRSALARARDRSRCSAPRACRRPLRRVAAALVALAAVALALLAGRPRRRVPAAGPLGLAAVRRSAAASRRCRASACPTAASTSGRGSRSASGGSAARRGRRAARVLAARAAAPASRPRRCSLLVTLYAVPAVRARTSRASSCAARCSRCSCSPSCGWRGCAVRDAPAAGRRRRPRPRSRRCSPRRRSTGREPWWDYETLGRRRRRGEGGRLQLGSRLRPAGLAARRPRAAARQGAPGRAYWKARDLDLFDGRGWRQDPRQRGEDPAAQLPASPAQRPRAGASTSRSRSATCARTASSPRGSRPRSRRGRLPDRRRRLRGAGRARPRRLLHGRRLHAAPDRAAAAREHRHALRGLAPLLRRDLPRRAGVAATASRSTSAACRCGSCGRSGASRARRRSSASTTSPDPPRTS